MWIKMTRPTMVAWIPGIQKNLTSISTMKCFPISVTKKETGLKSTTRRATTSTMIRFPKMFWIMHAKPISISSTIFRSSQPITAKVPGISWKTIRLQMRLLPCKTLNESLWWNVFNPRRPNRQKVPMEFKARKRSKRLMARVEKQRSKNSNLGVEGLPCRHNMQTL